MLLLDPDGGHFTIAPSGNPTLLTRTSQIYLPDTNVLITRFLSQAGVLEITDLMPMHGAQSVVRIAACVRGEIEVDMRCAPRFDYARLHHRASVIEADSADDTCAIRFTPEKGDAVQLSSTVPMRIQNGRDATARFALAAGEQHTFVLWGSGDDGPPDDLNEYGSRCFDETARYWRSWLSRSTYRGRSRGAVERWVLTLKLLTSVEHGSIVAAPTFGLPEELGGQRNWDYRFTWIRDAAFTVYAFVRLGFVAEATAFMHWIDARLKTSEDGSVRIMYRLDGTPDLPEEVLDHVAGYAHSRPVRIGNAAVDQLQLDSYGALMDAGYLANKHAEPVSYDGWVRITRMVDWVCENWQREDEGIWEFRGGRRHFLSSRLMSWVCVDRAVRMANKSSLPAPLERWQLVRNEIHHSVFTDFWNDEMGTYVQSKGSLALDASCLLMPLVRFISPTDPRWLSTLDAVGQSLADDAMVRRYDTQASAEVDSLDGDEGSFTVCSFWYVECLAKAGRTAEATLLFDKLLSYPNHLGLYAEELGPAGDHLGNFPQALTHLALISAAVAIERAT